MNEPSSEATQNLDPTPIVSSFEGIKHPDTIEDSVDNFNAASDYLLPPARRDRMQEYKTKVANGKQLDETDESILRSDQVILDFIHNSASFPDARKVVIKTALEQARQDAAGHIKVLKSYPIPEQYERTKLTVEAYTNLVNPKSTAA